MAMYGGRESPLGAPISLAAPSLWRGKELLAAEAGGGGSLRSTGDRSGAGLMLVLDHQPKDDAECAHTCA